MDNDNQRGRKRDRPVDQGYEEQSNMRRQQSQYSASRQSGLPLSNYAYIQYCRQLAQQQQQNNQTAVDVLSTRNRAQLLSNPFLGSLGGLPPRVTGNMPPLSRPNWPSASGVPNSNFLSSRAFPSPTDSHLFPNSGNNAYPNLEGMYASTATAQTFPPLDRTGLRHSGTGGEYKAESDFGSTPAAAMASLRQTQYFVASRGTDAIVSSPTPRRPTPATSFSDALEASLLSNTTTSLGRNIKLLYMPSDDESISPYQRFARMQIELFEAEHEDVDTNAQGRNRPVLLGQVGIRCIHCADLPPKVRTRAAVYYPSRLSVLYQAAQNIVNSHLPTLCESIPEEMRQKLVRLDNKRSSVGGGKNYWSDCAQLQGVIETPHGLRFRDDMN